MCFDFPGKIESIYRLMKFQCYYLLAHTIPNVRLIFRSNKLAHFWEFASLFVYYSSLFLNGMEYKQH